ncbi:hypothetical protein G4B88_024759 [Cannabis sativa]|uniref:RING-type E3 ubiquitin transferase n=1 Tax=Cannabis sativa TaxID=3483 RepID=A0A7J6GW84_CANSA|nr:hypothetical protein G4B88_024759 [Cannabis sativa]
MASNVKYFQSLGIIQTSSAHQQELSSSSSSGSAFPILVVALLSIMGTTLLLAKQEQEREQVTNNRVTSYHSPRKLKKCHHVSIMGDECIDLRINREHNKDYYDNEEEFSVQPLRRSFSWDSATDHRQLHSTVEEIISNNNKKKNYTRTSFFPFLHGRVSSWNSIVPFEL